MRLAMAKKRAGAERASWAAAQPDRPGEECKAAPGSWRPVVDRNACEGKRDCVEVCPYDVFEVRTMDDADYRRLSWMGTLKSMAHRWQTAYTPRAAQCHACGLCVVACPEKAIVLQRAS
jgi:NAD-dependent dihydropyrimidine dehydrogenase PreA subunit